MIRLGHPARLLPQIQRHSLDAVLSHSEEAEVVQTVRTEIDQALVSNFYFEFENVVSNRDNLSAGTFYGTSILFNTNIHRLKFFPWDIHNGCNSTGRYTRLCVCLVSYFQVDLVNFCGKLIYEWKKKTRNFKNFNSDGTHFRNPCVNQRTEVKNRD